MKKCFNKLIIFLFMFVFLLFSFSSMKRLNALNFDFSRPNSLDCTSMTAIELIEYITNSNVSEAEKKYLIEFTDTLKYDNKIPRTNVSTSLNVDTLKVHAYTYSYTDAYGNVITWVPYKATLNSDIQMFTFNDEYYELEFKGVLESDESIDIEYKLTVFLDKTKLNVLINDAYNTAKYYVDNDIIKKEEMKYQERYNQYLLDLEKYNQYLIDLDIYNNELVLYNQYLKDMKVYNLELEKYNKYLSDLNEYNIQLEKYNNYLKDLEKYEKDLIAYNNYLKELEKYGPQLEEYNTLLEKYEYEMAYINYSLSVMELIVTPMTEMERTLYNAIMGSTVTEVLDRKAELYEVGVATAVIKQAEEATYHLREIFEVYFNLENDEAKYLYYKSNYATIRKYLINLLTSLEYLYVEYAMVRNVIDMYEKKPQYMILISQLVLVCNAMYPYEIESYNGKYYFDDSWMLEKHTMDYWLEGFLFEDIDEYNFPLIKVYPDKPVPPIVIEEISQPVLPEEVDKPIAIEEVIEPVKPKDVIEPIKPEEVKEAIEPDAYEVDPIILALIEEYKNNILVYRDEYLEDFELNLYTSMNKKFKNSSEITVVFYDLNNDFIVSYTTDYASYINFQEDIPVKDGDEVFLDYKFVCWKYEDGTVLNLNEVVREGFVYPVYEGNEYRKYEITWIVDGKETKEEYKYGDIPLYSFEISKEYNGNVYYDFVSWDSEIKEVSENFTYTAILEEKYLIEEDNISASIKYEENNIQIDLSSFDNNMIVLDKFFDKVINEDSELELDFKGDEYSFSIDNLNVLRLKENDIKSMNVEIVNNDLYDYEFVISFFDNNEELIFDNIELNIEILGTFERNKSVLYLVDGDSLIEFRASINNDKIVVNGLCANKTYRIYPVYNVTLISNEYCNIESNLLSAKYNELIDLDITLLKEGIYLDSLSIIDIKNNQIEYNEEYAFLMPRSDVYVIPSYEFYNYTIEFFVDDELISSKVYKYGDKIIVPSNPFKASDDEYSYSFIGWDKEISEVTKDEVYNAIFEVKPLDLDLGSGKISIIRLLKISFMVTIIASITCIMYDRVQKNIVYKREEKV